MGKSCPVVETEVPNSTMIMTLFVKALNTMMHYYSTLKVIEKRRITSSLNTQFACKITDVPTKNSPFFKRPKSDLFITGSSRKNAALALFMHVIYPKKAAAH